MAPLGILFFAVGALLIRQVVVGRVKETPEDLKDFTVALLNGDTATMQTVFAQRGTNVDVAESGTVAAVDSATSTPSSSSDLLNEVVRLGSAAKGYLTGGTGPSYYDCSGLVWRAMKNLDIYTGSRFTTTTFDSVAPTFAVKVDSPAVGDVVLWPTHHMGVCAGNDRLYSARSRAKGINYSTISGDAGYFGRQPEYWRVTGARVPNENKDIPDEQ